MSGSVDDGRYERSKQFPLFMILVVIFDMAGLALLRSTIPPGSDFLFPLTVVILVLTTVVAYWLTYRGGLQRLNPLT